MGSIKTSALLGLALPTAIMAANSEIYMDGSFNLHYPDGATQFDDMPDELREVVDEYWGQFPPQHPLIKDAFGILFGLLYIISFFGNGCVLYVFLTTKTLRTPTNYFVLNLAFSDLLMMTGQALPIFFNMVAGEDYWCWGVLGCKLYAVHGAIVGTSSIWTMVVIGFDRWNVIVKGFNGTKITAGKALGFISVCWIFAIGIEMLPFIGWGKYGLEGQLITCSYEYMEQTTNVQTFVMFTLFTNYILPIAIAIFFYSQIVMAVVNHEKALREQAKKMGVDSLRSGEQAEESAEMKIAKVAVTNVFMWIAIWTPYAGIVMLAVFGDRNKITPLMAQCPSMCAKAATCFNPIVFALSHPKYREALGKKFPCLVIKEEVRVAAPAA